MSEAKELEESFSERLYRIMFDDVGDWSFIRKVIYAFIAFTIILYIISRFVSGFFIFWFPIFILFLFGLVYGAFQIGKD